MTEILQNIVDGLGRGSIYALLALGIAVIFGVMHLLNFAHGELVTISGYAAFWAFGAGWNWWEVAPLIVVVSLISAVVIERVAFSRVRGASDFTLLLTSFGIHFLVSALFVMFVGAKTQLFPRPSWIGNTVDVGGVSFEVFDLLIIVVTAVTLVLTTLVLQRTMFGLSIRAASADFNTARMMGVNSNRVIVGAFAMSGFLAGIAAIFWLMREGHITPTAGAEPMLKGVLASLIGGLGSLRGAVIGGLALGVTETVLRSNLPENLSALTEGFVFVLIAILFIFRPQGIISVGHAERV